jgi:hypothetical protein
MARPRSIFVDTDALLVAVLETELATVAAIDEELETLSPEAKFLASRTPVGFCSREQELRNYRELASVVDYDLDHLVGRFLTDSERVIHRKALREMEAEGLLVLSPPARATSIELTTLGREKATEILTAKEETPCS